MAEQPADKPHLCPFCGTPASRDPGNPHRPFCSERCKLLDLSKWLDGDYAIPGEPVAVDDNEER